MKWIDIEDIVENLQNKYPEEDIMSLRFTKLHSLVMSLENFKDEPNKSNEKILETIQANWLIYRQEQE